MEYPSGSQLRLGYRDEGQHVFERHVAFHSVYLYGRISSGMPPGPNHVMPVVSFCFDVPALDPGRTVAGFFRLQ